jgi:hypothetical protein
MESLLHASNEALRNAFPDSATRDRTVRPAQNHSPDSVIKARISVDKKIAFFENRQNSAILDSFCCGEVTHA